VSPFLDWLIQCVLRALYRCEQLRTSRSFLFNGILGVISFLVASGIWLVAGHAISAFFGVSETSVVGHAIVVLVHHAIATCFTFVLLRLSLPVFTIAQRAVAMYEMGLRWASVTSGDSDRLLRYYLKKHHNEAERIKVICISGQLLFGTQKTAKDCPLGPWAQRGLLDAVMPSSSQTNPTVWHRWITYGEDIKRDHYSDVGKLVKEIDDGKTLLKSHPNNTLSEHRILCMWRVVILHDHCLVQCYFPNVAGNISSMAATFVYEDTGPFSYYQTYAEMFRLIQQISMQGGTAGVPL
jgi:hypothetical protein